MSAPNGHAGPSSSSKSNGIEVLPAAVNHELSPQVDRKTLEPFIAELQVPFDPSLIEWRVTTTAADKARGQVIPYADQRAYTDRLNALFTPAGWTRKYAIHTSPNFQRGKDQKTVAKVLVTCELTIFAIGSHSATGEEWSDDENAATSAEAQAFKRAASCLGLGRYLYNFRGIWVDLDSRKRPKKLPSLPRWATPEGWRQGLRPDNKPQGIRETGENQGTAANAKKSPDVSLLQQIEAMAHPLGKSLYRGILKSVARVWRPSDIQDSVTATRVLEHMLAGNRGLDRLKVVLERVEDGHLQKALSSLNISSLERIDNLETLKKLVLSLEADDHSH